MKIVDLMEYLLWAVSFYFIIIEKSENAEQIILSLSFSNNSSKYTRILSMFAHSIPQMEGSILA